MLKRTFVIAGFGAALIFSAANLSTPSQAADFQFGIDGPQGSFYYLKRDGQKGQSHFAPRHHKSHYSHDHHRGYRGLNNRQVRRSLRHRGFRHIEIVKRRHNVVVVKAYDRRGNYSRLKVNKYTGQIIRHRVLSWAQPRFLDQFDAGPRHEHRGGKQRRVRRGN